MRPALLHLVVIGSMLSTIAPAPAQDIPGNAAVGRHVAETWCAVCHQIDKAATRPPTVAPSFPDVANLPSTTALALNVFLRSNHDVMPNYQISASDADNVVAYILSLKGK